MPTSWNIPQSRTTSFPWLHEAYLLSFCNFWMTRACLHREIFHKAGRHPSRDYTRPTSFLSVIFEWPEHAYIVKYSTKQDDILPVITRGLPPFFLYFLNDPSMPISWNIPQSRTTSFPWLHEAYLLSFCNFWMTRACLHREIFHKAGRHPSRDYTRPTSFLSVNFEWPEHAYIVKYSTKAGRHPSRDYTRPTSFLSVIFEWPEHAYIVKYSTKQDDILPVITRGLPPFFL